MLEQLMQLDTELFLFLNGMHNAFFDFIMFWISQTVVWIPLWIFFIYILVKNDRKNGLWMVLSLIIAVGLADFISVHLFKNVFERLRPCHNEEISALVHIVKDHCGGQYGFVSSHSTNMFAISTFMFLALRNKYRFTFFPLFIWAAAIAYSRIYLGVHYPADVIGGAILGSSISLVIWFVYGSLKLGVRSSELEV